MTLQELIAATPNGGLLDLGGQVFNTEETVRVTGRSGLTLRNFTIMTAQQ